MLRDGLPRDIDNPTNPFRDSRGEPDHPERRRVTLADIAISFMTVAIVIVAIDFQGTTRRRPGPQPARLTPPTPTGRSGKPTAPARVHGGDD